MRKCPFICDRRDTIVILTSHEIYQAIGINVRQTRTRIPHAPGIALSETIRNTIGSVFNPTGTVALVDKYLFGFYTVIDLRMENISQAIAVHVRKSGTLRRSVHKKINIRRKQECRVNRPPCTVAVVQPDMLVHARAALMRPYEIIKTIAIHACDARAALRRRVGGKKINRY